jgi:membrane-associated protein
MDISTLFDPNSIIAELGLFGILAILFAETGLLIGLAFPGDSLLFIAGLAASGSASALLGGVQLSPVALFIGAPIAATAGAQLGHSLGAKYGRRFFDRPEGRFFTQARVTSTEKWLNKYGVGKAIILARFIPFIRTLINPMCGVIGISARKFFIWNFIGAIIWTDGVILIGYLLGQKLEGSVDKYLLPIIALIIFISLVPLLIEVLREVRTKRHLS